MNTGGKGEERKRMGRKILEKSSKKTEIKELSQTKIKLRR